MPPMRPLPSVRLLAVGPDPLDAAVAAARTCYSADGPVVPDTVAAVDETDEGRRRRALERREALARSLYEAGHHTTFQHVHFVFVLEGVSRQFVWSFLHAHPFANSEQVSQRYVPVAADAVHVPDLPPAAETAFLAAVARRHEAYRRLVEVLTPVARHEVLRRFPGWGRHPARLDRAASRKALEVARAVLPVATLTALYHTVSCLSLFRYRRLCRQLDVPAETEAVVNAMVAAVLAEAPDLAVVMQEPLPLEETPEYRMLAGLHGDAPRGKAFVEEFDRDLGGLTSRLLARGSDNVGCVAAAVRVVFGVPRAGLSDEDAVRAVLDPAANTLLGEDLNLTTLSKLGRCLHHAHYTFAKKLSHAADSQDQRHRMTPAARPVLRAVAGEGPDVVVPRLVHAAGGEAQRLFDEASAAAWDEAAAVVRGGGTWEAASYLLPNATALRFIESADLLNLHHKHRMRLCYNAQEEIWQRLPGRGGGDFARWSRSSGGGWRRPAPCGTRRDAARSARRATASAACRCGGCGARSTSASSERTAVPIEWLAWTATCVGLWWSWQRSPRRLWRWWWRSNGDRSRRPGSSRCAW